MESLLGTTFTQLSTRSWAASLSIALMISICYSVERARRYFWVYHLYGWILPIIATGIIYLLSKLAKPKEDPMLRSKRLQKISSSVIIFTLVICITVILVSLLRFVRRTYRVNRIEQEHCQTNILNNETQPLLQDESEIENSQRAIPSSIPSSKSFFSLMYSYVMFFSSNETIAYQCSIITSCYSCWCHVYQHGYSKFRWINSLKK